jgi:hypothetical protein
MGASYLPPVPVSTMTDDETLKAAFGRVEDDPKGGVPFEDGRYLCVVRDGRVVEVKDAKGKCLVNGDDPMNVYTFVREFVGRDVLPVLINIAIERLAAMARRAPRIYPNN